MQLPAARAFLSLIIIAIAAAACGGASPGGRTGALLPRARGASSNSPIQHVIVIIQENRTFDNLFALFPGADGTTTGKVEAVPSPLQPYCPFPKATTVPLTETKLP